MLMSIATPVICYCSCERVPNVSTVILDLAPYYVYALPYDRDN